MACHGRSLRRLLRRKRRSLAQRASCWYAVLWNDIRCSGETPWRWIASRCSGVE